MSVFLTTPRIRTGPGEVESLGEEASRLGAKRAFLVTGPNLADCGHAARVEKILEDAGLRCVVYSEVEPDPDFLTAVVAADETSRAGADLVVGLGGGSNMDIAKTAAALAGCEVPIDSVYGVDRVPSRGVNLLLVPTTAGTGSEVTPVAIISDHRSGTKKAIVSPYLLPDAAILDPVLTLSAPPEVTAASGMDAIVHAIEAYTSTGATPLTDVFALDAARLLVENIRKAYRDGEDLAAREGMLLGSMMAGMAFGNAGVTATHAFAYPVGARYRIPHGVANTIMLPHVMEHNLDGAPERFAVLAKIIGGGAREGSPGGSGEGLLVPALTRLISDLGLPTSLGGYGASADEVPDLARAVMEITRILENNPREITLSDAEDIYKKAL